MAVIENTGQQANISTNTAKIFVRNNKFDDANFTNSTGSSVDLVEGQVLGRVNVGGEVKPLDSSASDGTQFPIGILLDDVTVANGATQQLSYCISGEVVESLLTFTYGDDLDTIIDGKTLRDRIGSDTVGVELVSTTELTGLDNQ